MSSTEDLITWLRQQWDKDERVAQQVIAEPGGFYLEAETDDTNILSMGAYVHRWNPKRVLAEVKAKRQRLDWLLNDLEHEPGPEPFPTWESCRTLWTEDMAGDEAIGYCSCGLDAWRNRLLAFEAQPYAGQPGWQEEWAA